MALTKAKIREVLSAAGVNAENMSTAVDAILDGHVTSINALREEIATLKVDAEKAPGLQKELEELKAKGDPDWQKKYEEEHQAFEDFKVKATQAEADREKSALYRKILRDAGIEEKRVDSIMKVTDLSKIEVKDGKISDAEKVAADVKTEWAEFIPQLGTKTNTPENPPANTGAKKTKDEIMAIKDPTERQQAIAENIELFQKG